MFVLIGTFVLKIAECDCTFSKELLHFLPMYSYDDGPQVYACFRYHKWISLCDILCSYRFGDVLVCEYWFPVVTRFRPIIDKEWHGEALYCKLWMFFHVIKGCNVMEDLFFRMEKAVENGCVLHYWPYRCSYFMKQMCQDERRIKQLYCNTKNVSLKPGQGNQGHLQWWNGERYIQINT